MYKTVSVEVPFIITEVAQHKDIKSEILDAIKEMGIFSYIQEPKQKLFNSDYHINNSISRLYYPNIEPIIKEVYNNILLAYDIPKESLPLDYQYWIQQYKELDYHAKHIHAACVFSSVYYIDLANDNAKTTFILNNKEIELEVKEGQVLTFPSCMPHTSKVNQAKQIKTVCSWNI